MVASFGYAAYSERLWQSHSTLGKKLQHYVLRAVYVVIRYEAIVIFPHECLESV